MASNKTVFYVLTIYLTVHKHALDLINVDIMFMFIVSNSIWNKASKIVLFVVKVSPKNLTSTLAKWTSWLKLPNIICLITLKIKSYRYYATIVCRRPKMYLSTSMDSNVVVVGHTILNNIFDQYNISFLH